MIRRLRDRHRWVIPLLALLALLAFAAALLGRHSAARAPLPHPLQSHGDV